MIIVWHITPTEFEDKPRNSIRMQNVAARVFTRKPRTEKREKKRKKKKKEQEEEEVKDLTTSEQQQPQQTSCCDNTMSSCTCCVGGTAEEEQQLYRCGSPTIQPDVPMEQLALTLRIYELGKNDEGEDCASVVRYKDDEDRFTQTHTLKLRTFAKYLINIQVEPNHKMISFEIGGGMRFMFAPATPQHATPTPITITVERPLTPIQETAASHNAGKLKGLSPKYFPTIFRHYATFVDHRKMS